MVKENMINPLPRSGNYLVDMQEDSDRSRCDDGDEPEWHCKECDKNVTYQEFNQKHRTCWDCWWKI